ncbi:hypothetical protein PIB30_030429 [Stylosanthes scabra]|uniref:Uncharacterized protein n=1 Tax=Stylosanthes scabra TaxID=79078 RepID=A0ABU6QBR0_9FABA|nr:hypothetical protein [Stylosanthes scabra]
MVLTPFPSRFLQEEQTTTPDNLGRYRVCAYAPTSHAYTPRSTRQMARTRFDSLAKGKTKLYRPPTRVSPRFTTLRSKDSVQSQIQAPDVPAKDMVTWSLPPKKRQHYRMGKSSSKKSTKTPCRRSRRIAALYSVTTPVPEVQEVIAISDDSELEEGTNLDVEGALPTAGNEGGQDLPKNDVYDALWAMLDAESENEAEEFPGQWDLDSVLRNWGGVAPDVGPAGPDQGLRPAAN